MKLRIKRGVEMTMTISVRENRKVQSCTNRQYRATGNTGKTKHWKNLHRAIKPKCLYRIAKIDYGHLKQQQKIKQQQGNLKISATRYDHKQCCNHINRYRR